ncbi:hypothetical protein PENNAL_c0432G11721, partial [Penicillium nalgiovense]
MICLSITRLRCLLSTFMPRLLSPGNPRETVLFGGPDPKRSSTLGSRKLWCFCKKSSNTTLARKGSSLPRLRKPLTKQTVRIWFPHNGIAIMEDIKSKGLDDVVLDAIVLQELGAKHRAQDDHGNTRDAFLVDLAVLEAGISRVWGRYGIPKFIPLSSDDPLILKQPTTDLESKKGLCYQRLHSKYLYEYGRRQSLAEVLGYEMP